MPHDVTSKNLRTASELTVIAPIRRGFIENADAISYAARLKLLLGVLYELRKGADERGSSAAGAAGALDYSGPLEQLQTLSFVQWAVIDNDTRLMLNVTFDRSWESYIRDIVDLAGPLLDVILGHCEGYDGHTTRDGYERFAAWVREHQVENHFFFAAEPGLTADDLRIHRELARLPYDILRERSKGKDNKKEPPSVGPICRELEERFAGVHVTRHAQTGGSVRDMTRIAGVLFDLRRYFSGSNGVAGASYLSARARAELRVFDEVAYTLLAGFFAERLNELLSAAKSSPSLSDKLLAAWCATLPNFKRATAMTTKAVTQTRAPLPSKALGAIQRGVLKPFRQYRHGALVLVRFKSARAGGEFLRKLRSLLRSELDEPRETSEQGKLRERSVTLALTLQGLRTLGLTDDELGGLPKEFRDGMEARAGYLGDIGAMHPSEWQLPQENVRVEHGDSPASTLIAVSKPQQVVALSMVDAVILVQEGLCDVAEEIIWSEAHPLFGSVSELVSAGADVLHVQPLHRKLKGKHEPKAEMEPFGFRDDISQPHVRIDTEADSPSDARRAEDCVDAGELVLGYPNARAEVVRCPIEDANGAPLDLLKDGSFFVARKLEQHVDAFEEYIRSNVAALKASDVDIDESKLKAMLMGRYPDDEGTPLADPHQGDNGFDFKGDGDGLKCPFHAHVRRANPRDEGSDKTNSPDGALTPRIVRRGLAFDEGTAKGLMFMALNASIADQFEVLQRWITGGNSTGVASALADLIAGAPREVAFPVRVKQNGALLVRWLMPPPKPFVSLRWGLYAFVPSLPVIDALAERAADTNPQRAAQRAAQAAARPRLAAAARGLVMLSKLSALPEAIARDEWKRLLEDRQNPDDTRALWAAVLAKGGALRTPYGVLVAGKRLVYRVLSEPATYSVREYYHRMTKSIGALHLGMDPEPTRMPDEVATAADRAYEADVAGQYDAFAAPLNRAMYALTYDTGKAVGLSTTRAILTSLRGEPPVDPAGPMGTAQKVELVTIDATVLGAAVVQELSARWFATPSSLEDVKAALDAAAAPDGKRAPIATFADYRQCSAYVFFPNPEPWVGSGAGDAGKAIDATLAHDSYAVVRSLQTSEAWGATLPEKAAGLKGAAFGFLATTVGSFASVVAQWVQNGELTRLQRELGACDQPLSESTEQRLKAAILAAMQRAPAPSMLHRTAVQADRLGGAHVQAGDRVVVSLGSVAAEDPSDTFIMFGGAYRDEPAPETLKATHACPGRELSLGVLVAMVWTLLQQRDLRQVSAVSPFKLSFVRDAGGAR